MSVKSSEVAEVEYYYQLALDHFSKLDALTKKSSNDIILDMTDLDAKRSTIVKRILKAVEQLRGECEKLAITGATAETVAAAEARRGRLGIPSPTSNNRTPNVFNKSNRTPTHDEAGLPVISVGSALTQASPVISLTERWRWVAYALEIDAHFFLKYGERARDEMWDSSLVASTLRSRVHALLFELIPLERLLDGGKIRKTTINKGDSIIHETPITPTASVDLRDADQLVKVVMSNVQDALQQLRSSCRDAITIKETAVLEARLKASQAQVVSHFNVLNSSAALTPFELFVVQFFAAEAVRLATSYNITMEGGNSASGANAATLARSQQREAKGCGELTILHPLSRPEGTDVLINSESSMATTIAAPTATQKPNTSNNNIPFSPTGYLSTPSPSSAALSPPSTMAPESISMVTAGPESSSRQAKACTIM